MITAYKWYCIARSNTIGSSAGVKIDIKHFRILAHVSVDWGNVVLTVQETNLTEDITGSLRLRKNGNSWYLDVKISQSYKEESIEVSLYDNDHYDWYSYTDNELSGSTICLIEDVASVVVVQNADNLWAVNADGDLYPKDKEDGTPRNIISYGGISFGGNSSAGGEEGGEEGGEGGTIGSLSNVSPSADAISEQTQILVKDSNSSEYVPRNIDEIAGFNEDKLAEYLLAHEYVTKDYLHGLIFPDPENNAVRTALNLVVEGGVSFGGVSSAGGEGGGEGGTIKYPLTWSGYSSGSFDGSVSANIVIPTTLPANDVYTWAKQPSLLLSDIPDLSSKYLSLSGGTFNFPSKGIGVTTNPRVGQFDRAAGSLVFQLGTSNIFDIVDSGWRNVMLRVAPDEFSYYGNSIIHSGNTNYFAYREWSNQDANNASMGANFTYANNAPFTGPLATFSCGGYDLQLNGGYGAAGMIAYRTKNGDNGAWNSWRQLVDEGNIVNYTAGNANALGGLSAEKYLYGFIGAYDANAQYDFTYRGIALGANLPSSSQYGSLLTLPYRKTQGNTCPDFAAQIFLPNGDDATPDMFFRTSLSTSWNPWRRVIAENSNGNVLIGRTADSGDKLQVEGDCLINGRNYNAISYTSDNLAYYGYDNGLIHGTIKITLPNSWNSDMSMFEIWVYEYNSMAGSKIFVSGYSYGGSYWYNTKYAVLGNYNKGVRLAHDGSKLCILLGNTSSYWEYPQIYLKARSHGLVGREYIHSSGYSISLVTDESSFSIIQNVSIADTYTNNIIASGEVTFGSDARYKDKIKDTSISLKSIAEAPLFTYRWNDRDDNRIYLGTTAQYWLDTPFKYAVNTTNPDFLGLGYGELGVAIGIVNSRKLLNHESRITTLERDKEKERLKKQLKKLQYQFRQLEKQLQQYRRALQ